MIGEEVRRRREGLGLTGAQLAARAGMAPSAVSQIETGKRTPSSTSVIKLAAALGVDVGELFPKGQAPLPDLEVERRPEARPTERELFGLVYRVEHARLRKDLQALRRMKESGIPQQFPDYFNPEGVLDYLTKQDHAFLARAYHTLMKRYISAEVRAEQLQNQLREHDAHITNG